MGDIMEMSMELTLGGHDEYVISVDRIENEE